MEVLNKIQQVLSSPDKFFESVKKEPLGPAFKYLAVIMLVPTVLMLIFAYAATSIFTMIFGPMLMMLGGTQSVPLLGMLTGILTTFAIIGVILWYICGLLGSFIGSAVLHVFVYLLGGKNGYSNTYKTAAYATTPSTLIGWIPLIGFIFGLWSLVLEVKGLKALQGMTTGRAVLAILLPVIIIGAVVGSNIAAGMTFGLPTA